MSGVAGRTNYSDWERKTQQMMKDHEAAEAQEQKEAEDQLGKHKYAVSHAQQEEREKSKNLQKTKEKLELFQKREAALIRVLGDDEGIDSIKRVTRQDLEAGQRVLKVSGIRGTADSPKKIIITQDLSLLESKVPLNPQAKSFPDDAENEQKQEPQERTIYGLIKLYLEDLEYCTIVIEPKIITQTLEITKCANTTVVVASTTTLATIQADLCEQLSVTLKDAVSGKVEGMKRLPWGHDADDRIFHAGCSLHVQVVRDDLVESEMRHDYQTDDRTTASGNATLEEFQYVTSFDLPTESLVTEAVVRTSTNKNVRAMTERELQKATEQKEKITKRVVELAEKMVNIKDKDGNALVKKEVTPEDKQPEILTEIEQLKVRGNEAFGAGEYGQAILQYSLGIDKSSELGKIEFPVDVLYSNRAAAFLKMGDFGKAIEDADAALDSNPENIKACFRKGLALHGNKQYEQAMPILAKAYKKEPKNKQIQQALQFCEVRLQQDLRNRMNQ